MRGFTGDDPYAASQLDAAITAAITIVMTESASDAHTAAGRIRRSAATSGVAMEEVARAIVQLASGAEAPA